MRKRLLKLFIQLTFLCLSILSIFFFLVWVGFFGVIPDTQSLKNIKNNLATEIYSADGVLIGRYYLQERSKTAYSDIPEHVKNALIATEDARFYDHNGIDKKSLLRVLIKTIALQNERSGGGSTLSQQLSRNIFPREEHGKLTIPVNKLKELIMAYRLEHIYDKEEILTLYLNTVPFGDNVYGIDMAARRFYSKKVAELKLDEAAVLIGMLKSNYYYNPRIFPDQAKKRRDVVLAQMKKYGYLNEEGFTQATMLPIKIAYKKEAQHDGIATHFRNQVKKQVIEWCSTHKKTDGTRYNLYTDGLQIHTTIDSKLQLYAENAMKEHMKELQTVFNAHWKNTKPWTKKPSILQTAIQNSSRYRSLKKEKFSQKEIMDQMNKKRLMNIFTWSGEVERKMSAIDSIKHYLSILQTGVLAMEPNTGDVKVWIGGINHKYFQFDHVNVNTKRQVGSTFKPFVYAAALESGMDPCKHISGSRVAYSNLANWTPDNADKEENKLKYSYEGALAKSVNTVTIKLLEEVGISKTVLLAQNAGIKSELPQVPSVALGTASISLIEMVTAYCSFANGGLSVKPRMISSIKDSEGKVIAEFKKTTAQKRIISVQSAQIMNHFLKSVVDNGTASRLRWKYSLRNDIAGKTGTTQNNTDGWFIGYNPQLVVGTWVGADNPSIRFRSTSLGSGANTALPIYAKLLSAINKDRTLSSISRSKFDELSHDARNYLACELYKDDKNFFERVLKIERKKEKVKNKDFGEKDKKSIFKKFGDMFKKKKKKGV